MLPDSTEKPTRRVSGFFCPNSDFEFNTLKVRRYKRIGNFFVHPVLIFAKAGIARFNRRLHIYKSRASKKKDSKKKKKVKRFKRGRPQKKKVPQTASYLVYGLKKTIWEKERAIRLSVR
jgi:hypothetical protein